MPVTFPSPPVANGTIVTDPVTGARWIFRNNRWVSAGGGSGANDQGPPGPQGDPGAAGTISIGSVNSVPAGTPPSVTNTGTASAATLNFWLPQGATGATGGTGANGAPGQPGQQGQQGPPGTGIHFVGTVPTASALDPNYTGNDGDLIIASDTGIGWVWDSTLSTPAWVAIGPMQSNVPGPAGQNGTNGTNGINGSNGSNGVDGQSATVTVNPQVITVPNGQPAAITTSGSGTPNVAMQFTIPAGPQGPAGTPASIPDPLNIGYVNATYRITADSFDAVRWVAGYGLVGTYALNTVALNIENPVAGTDSTRRVYDGPAFRLGFDSNTAPTCVAFVTGPVGSAGTAISWTTGFTVNFDGSVSTPAGARYWNGSGMTTPFRLRAVGNSLQITNGTTYWTIANGAAGTW